MPPEQHLLVEPVDREEVLTEAELEIARRVEPDPFVVERRLVEAEARSEVLELGHRALGDRFAAVVPRATRAARSEAGRSTRRADRGRRR